MLKLIFRDLFIYQKRNLVILPLFALMFVFFVGPSGGTAGVGIALMLIAPFALTMTAYTSFAYDEVSKFNKFLRAMPVPPKTIVLSRYAACLLSAVSGTVCGVLFALISNVAAVFVPALKRDISFNIDLFMMWIIILAFYCAILMPVLYKFGYMKTRYPLLLVIVAISASGPSILSGTGISRALSDALSSVGTTGGHIILLIVSLVALYGSLNLSVSIFSKKEE